MVRGKRGGRGRGGRGRPAPRGPVTLPPGPVDLGGDLNSAVDGLGRMPPVVSASTDLSSPTSTRVDVGGVAYVLAPGPATA